MVGLACSSESLELYREGLGLKLNVLSATLLPAECQSSVSSSALQSNSKSIFYLVQNICKQTNVVCMGRREPVLKFTATSPRARFLLSSILQFPRWTTLTHSFTIFLFILQPLSFCIFVLEPGLFQAVKQLKTEEHHQYVRVFSSVHLSFIFSVRCFTGIPLFRPSMSYSLLAFLHFYSSRSFRLESGPTDPVLQECQHA